MATRRIIQLRLLLGGNTNVHLHSARAWPEPARVCRVLADHGVKHTSIRQTYNRFLSTKQQRALFSGAWKTHFTKQRSTNIHAELPSRRPSDDATTSAPKKPPREGPFLECTPRSPPSRPPCGQSSCSSPKIVPLLKHPSWEEHSAILMSRETYAQPPFPHNVSP